MGGDNLFFQNPLLKPEKIIQVLKRYNGNARSLNVYLEYAICYNGQAPLTA